MGIHTWETAFKFCYLYSNIKNNNYNPNLLNSLVFSFSHINLVAEVLVTVNGESRQSSSINDKNICYSVFYLDLGPTVGLGVAVE